MVDDIQTQLDALRVKVAELDKAISVQASPQTPGDPIHKIPEYTLRKAIEAFGGDIRRQIAERGYGVLRFSGKKGQALKLVLRNAGYLDGRGRQIKPLEMEF